MHRLCFASKWRLSFRNIQECQIIMAKKRRRSIGWLLDCRSTNRRTRYNVSFNKLIKRRLILFRARPTSSYNVSISIKSSRRENSTKKMKKPQPSNTSRNAKSTMYSFCLSLKRYTKRHYAYKTIKLAMGNAKVLFKHVRSLITIKWTKCCLITVDWLGTSLLRFWKVLSKSKTLSQ